MIARSTSQVPTVRLAALSRSRVLRCTLLGIGAMASPRYRPAGVLVEFGGRRVMIDGGPGAEPTGRVDAWLVTDLRAELISQLRRLARRAGTDVTVAAVECGELRIDPHPVVHTSHAAFGYRLRAPGGTVVWAPEFFTFPRWARGAALMFAEAASWSRPILFAGGVGGHAPVLEVCRAARAARVQRLVLAHLGRPTLRALDAGHAPPFGEFGEEESEYALTPSGRIRMRPFNVGRM